MASFLPCDALIGVLFLQQWKCSALVVFMQVSLRNLFSKEEKSMTQALNTLLGSLGSFCLFAFPPPRGLEVRALQNDMKGLQSATKLNSDDSIWLMKCVFSLL